MTSLSRWLSRIAVAFCFLSFGVWELIDPKYWVDYVPGFVSAIVSAYTMVLLHGVALSIVGVGILIHHWQKVWTTLAALLLLEITVSIGFEEGFSTIFIRDASLLLFALAMWADAFYGKE